MELPDLTGQPPWVVIVVVGLFAAGTLGSALLGKGAGKKKRRDRELDAAPDSSVARVPSASSGSVDVLSTSVNAIIEAGRRADEEADAARAETREVRRKYDRAVTDLSEARRAHARTLADLTHCEARVTELRDRLNGGQS